MSWLSMKRDEVIERSNGYQITQTGSLVLKSAVFGWVVSSQAIFDLGQDAALASGELHRPSDRFPTSVVRYHESDGHLLLWGGHFSVIIFRFADQRSFAENNPSCRILASCKSFCMVIILTISANSSYHLMDSDA